VKQTNEQRWTRWLYQRFPYGFHAQNMTDPGSVPYDVYLGDVSSVSMRGMDPVIHWAISWVKGFSWALTDIESGAEGQVTATVQVLGSSTPEQTWMLTPLTAEDEVIALQARDAMAGVDYS